MPGRSPGRLIPFDTHRLGDAPAALVIPAAFSPGIKDAPAADQREHVRPDRDLLAARPVSPRAEGSRE